MSTTYYTDSGNTVHLGPQIGKGGEGIVYSIHGDNQNVAKIYIKQQPAEVHRKILAMVNNPPHDPTLHGPTKHHSIAWPSDILYVDRQKLQFAGFIMPFIDTKNFQKILGYLNYESRRQKFCGNFTWLHLHATARNLASCVSAIHEKGYCVGDLNESNVLVQISTPLTIIDCDSFQVADTTGKVFRCKVGKREYTAPEIIDCKKYEDVDRTQETDCFALGIMIFQLLMEGFHPYSAMGQLVNNAPNIPEKIKLGIFPYNTSRRGIEPPEYAPPFDILAPEIRSFFIRCFDAGHKSPTHRPTAKEWMSALHKLLSTFVTCQTNENHRYLPHMNSCPWCTRLNKFGEKFHSFPSSIGAQIKLLDPNNQMVSKQEREAFLLTFIEMALMDGYVSAEEESYLIDQGLKLQISEKETKKLIADEVRKKGLSAAAMGQPRLVINKTHFHYSNLKNGSVLSETIEISNSGTGVLTGSISSTAGWAKVSGSIAPIMQNQSQRIQLVIDTSILSNGFSGTGTVSVKTNGGNATISVSLSTERLSNPASQTLGTIMVAVAMLAAVGFGVIKYSNNHKVTDPDYRSVENKKAPVPEPAPAPVPESAPAPMPAQSPETPLIYISTAVVTVGLNANQRPLGFGTDFQSGTKRIYYYISYSGGIPDTTMFIFKWFENGNQIRESQFNCKYASGNVWNYLDYDFQPGQYEVQLYANNQQLAGTPFRVIKSSADIQMEELQRQQNADRQRREAMSRSRQIEEQQRPGDIRPFPGERWEDFQRRKSEVDSQRRSSAPSSQGSPSGGWGKSRDAVRYEDN